MATQPSEQQGNSNHADPPAGISEEVLDGLRYRPLLQAAFEGDWESAKSFFQQHPASETAVITSRSETVLHIAALNAQDQFVENLVKLLSQRLDVLKTEDCNGRTALHNAVLCGRIRMVEALVKSNPSLTQIPDKEGRVPFDISTREASMHKEIAWFLARKTTDEGPGHPFSSPHALESIIGLTYAGHLDIVLYLVERYPRFLLMKGPKETDNTILGVLARMQSHFLSGTRLGVWEALIYKFPTIERIHDVKLRHVAAVELAKQICIEISSKKTAEITQFFQDRDLLGQAALKGISELVKLCIHFFPELIWISPCGYTFTILAVQNRHERILRLFLKVSSTNRLSLAPAPTPDESFFMMAAATKYNPYSSSVTNISGSAFQLQRELQWFKAVESWVAPDLRTIKCDCKTFWQTFVDEHEKLLQTGKKWVEDTANSCMLVSTLIATVLFAATFTVPGSSNGDTGLPLLLGEDSFLIFAISDALGLLSSVMAILLFLAILTSRCEPQDFLDSLPKKIIMGLFFLFLSLAFMLVAFAAALIIVLDKRLEWVIIPIALLIFPAVALFVVLQLPLLYQMVKSTYGPSIFCSEGTWK
ncbi:hypothetical protein BT93_L1470 [Corymbia citriodora subsp. variegata]|uniref:PGG domain-containing protein n=1 Tax=Corymbia citriodora subsp. variegata TaxID=360336 RepID=A0A8T0CS35_CORYI|nr:hypothetical protein BT93_L1470 [Corymbia citriodora subsp. variegata]